MIDFQDGKADDFFFIPKLKIHKESLPILDDSRAGRNCSMISTIYFDLKTVSQKKKKQKKKCKKTTPTKRKQKTELCINGGWGLYLRRQVSLSCE